MSYTEELQHLNENNQRLFGLTGETGKGFQQMHGAAIKDETLDKKTKELISLGISISIRCEGCIISHVNSCINAGATMEEIVDTVNVAILMSGGPGVAYGGKALECAEEFFKNK